MAEEKVYTAEVISDTPFPEEQSEPLTSSQSSTGGTYSASTIKDQPLPKKVIAQETIGSSLNTKARKIMQEYSFTESGGLQIGKYVPGVSGDTRISPSGIVMRNKDGNTTLAQDGDTGDAVFAGKLQAGAFMVSNNIIIEESSNGNGRMVFLNNGLRAVIIGDPN